MGDIARCSLGKETDYYNEELLYRMFGINAELLIDHAWGWEPCTIATLRRISRQPTASVPARCFIVRIPMRRQGSFCGRWPTCLLLTW